MNLTRVEPSPIEQQPVREVAVISEAPRAEPVLVSESRQRELVVLSEAPRVTPQEVEPPKREFKRPVRTPEPAPEEAPVPEAPVVENPTPETPTPEAPAPEEQKDVYQQRKEAIDAFQEADRQLITAEADYITATANARRKGLMGRKYTLNSKEFSKAFANRQAALRTLLETSQDHFEAGMDRLDQSVQDAYTKGTLSDEDAETAIINTDTAIKVIDLERKIAHEQYQQSRLPEDKKLRAYALGKWASWNSSKLFSKDTLKKAAVTGIAGFGLGALTVATLPAIGLGLAPLVGAGVVSRMGRSAATSQATVRAREFAMTEQAATDKAEHMIGGRSTDIERIKTGEASANPASLIDQQTKQERLSHKKRLAVVGGIGLLGVGAAYAGHQVAEWYSGKFDGVERLSAGPAIEPTPPVVEVTPPAIEPSIPSVEVVPPVAPELSVTPEAPAVPEALVVPEIPVAPEASVAPEAPVAPAEADSKTGIVRSLESPKGGEYSQQYSQIVINAGEGFENSLQDQYDLTDAEARQVYEDILPELRGTADTYYINGDPSNIGITNKGIFQFNAATRAALERALLDLEEED